MDHDRNILGRSHLQAPMVWMLSGRCGLFSRVFEWAPAWREHGTKDNASRQPCFNTRLALLRLHAELSRRSALKSSSSGRDLSQPSSSQASNIATLASRRDGVDLRDARVWIWRSIDDQGEVMDKIVRKRRDARAVLRWRQLAYDDSRQLNPR